MCWEDPQLSKKRKKKGDETTVSREIVLSAGLEDANQPIPRLDQGQ